jgi:ABC-type antimicrobial peptide transport system permease subunit
LREGLSLTLCGIALGLASAAALTRFLSGYLYGVAQHDLGAFVVVATLLTGAALLACWFPTRRAIKVDPLVALRHD